MSSTFVDTAGVPDARIPRHHYPGLYVPPGFWVMYAVGIIGCSVDAILALWVINTGFRLLMGLSILIVVMLGAIAAEAATAAASAIAALSPQERALRDTALATPRPERPAEADQHDMAGAVAAAEYFITLYPYVYATGDLTAFRTMSDATCKFCDSVINNTTSMHTAGGWEDPWEHHTTFTSITADVSTPNNRYVVEFHVVSDQHVSHRIGEPPKTYETTQGPILIQVLWKDDTGWIVEGVNPQ